MGTAGFTQPCTAGTIPPPPPPQPTSAGHTHKTHAPGQRYPLRPSMERHRPPSTVECITSGLHLCVFLIRSAPPPLPQGMGMQLPMYNGG